MGRHQKQVVTSHGLDRRESGYYATPKFVADFICQTLLELNPAAKTCFDPCVGKGELVTDLINRGISVDGMDIISFKKSERINFINEDFLSFYWDKKSDCIFGRVIDLPYDLYVANPPYNCHETTYIRDNKLRLGSLFGDIGVHNMYSMFMSAMIDSAKPGALLGIITLDSFLTARAHEALRDQIFASCSLHYLILCPNDLFRHQDADVRTCILILQKGKAYQKKVGVLNRPESSAEFMKSLDCKAFVSHDLDALVLRGQDDRKEIVVGVPPEVQAFFTLPRLGSLFRCVTGISTGNDTKYLSSHKRLGFSVPFYKNPGSTRFYTEPNAYLADEFLTLDNTVTNFMVRNKDLLYMPGITCSSMGVPFGACYLPAGGTYGVNANIVCDENDTWWLLAYLNSYVVTYIVRGILNRSNMITSGYVSRIPIPGFREQEKRALHVIAKEAYEKRVTKSSYPQYIAAINEIVDVHLKLSDGTRQCMKEFAEDILRYI